MSDKFEQTPAGYNKAMLWLRFNNLDHLIQNEQSTDGYTVIALANELWVKNGSKDDDPLLHMLGKTISAVERMCDKEFTDDTGFLKISFTDNTSVVVESLYGSGGTSARCEYDTGIDVHIPDETNTIISCGESLALTTTAIVN